MNKLKMTNQLGLVSFREIDLALYRFSYIDDVSATVSKTMSRIRGKGNKTTEMRFRGRLIQQRVRGWILHPTDIEGRPDIFFRKKKLAIFLDGCFWHGCPHCGHIPKTRSAFWKAKITRTKERDREKEKKLKKQGIKVLRFWEHEIQKNLDDCMKKVIQILNKKNLKKRKLLFYITS
jgi:DNA mismatch endonuclease (patch repair protein)